MPDTGLGVTYTMVRGLVPSFMERRLGIGTSAGILPA